MVLLIFLLILAYGLWQLFGAAWMFLSILPFLVALPIVGIKRLGHRLIHGARDRRNARRREVWNNYVQMRIDELNVKLGDQGSVDENGTPYELP